MAPKDPLQLLGRRSRSCDWLPFRYMQGIPTMASMKLSRLNATGTLKALKLTYKLQVKKANTAFGRSSNGERNKILLDLSDLPQLDE